MREGAVSCTYVSLSYNRNEIMAERLTPTYGSEMISVTVAGNVAINVLIPLNIGAIANVPVANI